MLKIIFFIILFLLVLSCMVTVPQQSVGLLETFGKYKRTLQTGLHFKLPIIQRIRRVNLSQQPLRIEPYTVITKDNASVQASVTLDYHITGATKYEYGNSDSVQSMVQLVRGILRDIIGRKDLTDALGSTEAMNKELQEKIGDLTDNYGIHVDRINIDEIQPSDEVQRSMEEQLRADREKTAAILKAQGESQSLQITTQAKNDALKATAKAEAEATKSKADAESYRIDTVQASLNKTSEAYFKNQSIEAYKTLANSKANLVVVPTDQADKFGTSTAQAKVLADQLTTKNNKE